MNFKTLGSHLTNSYVFKGAKRKPFLAPRGVFVSDNMLVVSDTGQNRVFIWKHIPTKEFEDPDVILGQEGITDCGRNANHKVTSSTLHYPSGIWTNGKILIVADAWNHRVLIWHSIPIQNAQPADVVLGQADFESNTPNLKGQASSPKANSLNWPYGVFSDGKRLWIADTGNRRILYYENIPKQNFEKATGIIGKAGFNNRDYASDAPIWPYSVKISDKGQMAVADTQFYRVLIWKHWKQAFEDKAHCIIGQKGFDDCGQNQFKLQPEANTLSWTYDACFYKEEVLVNDTGNSRILGFKSLPTKNNTPADYLVGRPDFNTSSEYKGNLAGTQTSLYWPFSITTSLERLFIADTGNHRLIIGRLET